MLDLVVDLKEAGMSKVFFRYRSLEENTEQFIGINEIRKSKHFKECKEIFNTFFKISIRNGWKKIEKLPNKARICNIYNKKFDVWVDNRNDICYFIVFYNGIFWEKMSE